MNAESVVLKVKETGGGLGKGVQGKSHEVRGAGWESKHPIGRWEVLRGTFFPFTFFF